MSVLAPARSCHPHGHPTYSCATSPLTLRVKFVLAELVVSYDVIELNIPYSKPDWYMEKVNPAGLVRLPTLLITAPPESANPPVPARTAGPAPHLRRPPLREDEAPSPSALAVTDSALFLAFLADDLFPAAGLRPTAIAAHLADLLCLLFTFAIVGEPAAPLVAALGALEGTLPPDGGWVAGAGEAWSVADAAVVPVLLFLRAGFRAEAETMDAAEAGKVARALEAPLIARYLEDNLRRESVAKLWDEEAMTKVFKHVAVKRVAAAKAASARA
ncbi:uncharacterized protein BXZ73DRAFT_80937 [Epithele typhae]|uniref:uncharacterized protein n=1 Tax=Epithele typhae TaxID=378194 RepID=UPI0020088804|nr:uncharacterized protein BXZ73DRAFT_80937 [Epithele typhae]KAH9916968.1 hypothetical protein BXZ73DRAFT_80937 [Epithele typhae]